MKSVIFLTSGALGENIIFSSYAKEYNNLGYKCFLSGTSKFRLIENNPEVYDFVWAKNPYISGEKYEKFDDNVHGMLVFKKLVNNETFLTHYKKYNNITNIIDIGNFNILIFNPNILKGKKEVETYYAPVPKKEFKDTVFVDILLSKYRHNYYQNSILLFKDKLKSEKNVKFLMKTSIVKNADYLYDISNEDIVYYKDIYEYCDILSNSKKLICFETGCAILALNYTNVDSYLSKEYNRDVNQIYHKTNKMNCFII